MDTCSSTFCPGPDWQATSLGLLMNLRNAMLALPENYVDIYQQAPKSLTKEATYMICVLFIFLLFAVTGSAITIYEYLSSSRKTESQKNINVSRKNKKNKTPKKSTTRFAGEDWINKFKTFFNCFCILKNGRKLLNTSNKDQFECIRGIRFLSNFWIILLHIFMGYMSSIRNVEELKPMMGMWTSQLVLNGQYAVDAFFVIGGFLNAYSFFLNYDKNNGNVSWLAFYLKRIMRLTPVYMVVLGFYAFLFPYTGSGPIWPTFNTNPVCEQSWTWNLFYINNFKEYTSQCMEWCWYLAADMQFYSVSPIFLISLLKSTKVGYFLTGACIIASCIASFIITKQLNLVDGLSRIEYNFHDLESFFGQYWTYFDVVYIKPYTRISAYLVAILLAYCLFKRKFSKCSRKTFLFGWIVTGILWYIAYFGLFKREESIIETAVFNGVKHLIYSIGLSWVIFTCLTGQAGTLNRFLSWKIFGPLAKLSYCAYLIHPIVLVRYYQTAENLEEFNVFSMLQLTSYVYFWTYIFSLMTFLLVEFPVLNMIDLILPKKK